MKLKKLIKVTPYFLLACFFVASSSCGHIKNSTSSIQISRAEDVGFSSERLMCIDSLLSHAVNAGTMPNALTYIYRHGKLVYHKAFGWKNIESKEPVQLNSIFRIASQTKALTSVGLMILYEKGLFQLDDSVSKYIPEFKNSQVLISINSKDSSFASRPAKRPITIRDLLTHTSGIPYGNLAYQKAHIPSVNSLEKLTIGDVVKKIAKLPLDHDPGEEFTYGLSTDVIGYLIEVLSGMPLDQYMKQAVFDPLDMKDTYFYLPAEKVARLVTLYANDSINGKLHTSENISNQTFPYAGARTYFSGGAGVVGTISDYANFCQMLLEGGNYNGKQVLGRKTIELMLRNQIADLEVWETKNKFGLGFELTTDKGAAILPRSVGAFSWGGMYATNYLIDPKEDMFMLIYTNAEPFFNNVNGRFFNLVYQALLAKNKHEN